MPRGLWLLVVAGAALSGCDRESRPLTSQPETAPAVIAINTFSPGPPAAAPSRDPRAAVYEGSAFHISQGQQYFRWFNCNGCHANGGGGMGPALMDDKWIYGGSIEQIVATIDHGRPNGMPSFHGRIPAQQMWQIAAYVRSLSGNADKLAAPSRTDSMRSIPPINNIDRQPPEGGAAGGAR
jgi:cytochrome c oxidase cbb3-type subunit 3